MYMKLSFLFFKNLIYKKLFKHRKEKHMDTKKRVTVEHEIVSNSTLGEFSTVWAGTELADTVKTLTEIEQPSELKKNYLILVENPSTETDLSIYLYIKQTFNSTTRYCHIGSFSVPVSPDEFNVDQTNKISCTSYIVEGPMLAQGLNISISNQSDITTGFTSIVILREI